MGFELAAPDQEVKVGNHQRVRVVEMSPERPVQIVELLLAGDPVADYLGAHAAHQVQADGPARVAGWIELGADFGRSQAGNGGWHRRPVRSGSTATTQPPGLASRVISVTTSAGSGMLTSSVRVCTRSNVDEGSSVCRASPATTSTFVSPHAATRAR